MLSSFCGVFNRYVTLLYLTVILINPCYLSGIPSGISFEMMKVKRALQDVIKNTDLTVTAAVTSVFFLF